MRSLLALVVVATACGDNLATSAIPAADDLVIVAHQDDDLLFIQHDIYDRVTAHEPTTIVYVTAGDAGSGIPFATARINSLKAAYQLLAGTSAWACDWTQVATHNTYHCRLPDAQLSLVFLGYPDGGVSGELPGSLLALWQGDVNKVTTIAERPTTYTRDQLIDTVTEIITTTQPRTIRTLEIAATHGADHEDHMMVGALTMLATMKSGTTAELLSYRGYDTASEASSTPEWLYADTSIAMRAYEACMTSCDGTCGVSPCTVLEDPRYVNFLHRRYAVAMRQPPLGGVMRSENNGCIVVDDDGVPQLGECALASHVDFNDDGTIGIGDGCLANGPDGLAIGDCTNAQVFRFDDEGHVWAAQPPAPQPNMAVMHSLCIVGDEDGLRVDVCGAGRDARWDLLQPTISTPRLAVSGRAVRLADIDGDGKADLCTISNAMLACAHGDGSGVFGKLVPVGHLAIEPQSLALGDVDGDGLVDACGRDKHGITCALAAANFAPTQWSTSFASSGPVTAADRSLAIVNGQVCGAMTGGVACIDPDHATGVVSRWPAAGAAVWPGDFDGDGKPDWCTADASGVSCGIAAQAAHNDAGISWGFSAHAMVESSTAVDGMVDDAIHTAVADITGDGRADMCTAIGNRVLCAASQRHGFGPRRLTLVVQRTIQALWLGDLDGDGRADPCVDDGSSITCALSP